MIRSAPLLLLLLAQPLVAAEGPGFPNIDRPGQQDAVLSSVNTTHATSGSKAVSAVMMHRGYLFAPLGADHGGGQGNGALSAYDISNPSSPVRIFDSRDHRPVYHDAAVLHYLGDSAENHSPVMAGDLMLVSEKRVGSAGFSLLDVANLYDENPATLPQVVGRYTFPNVTNPSNYDGYSFSPAMQGKRYVFAPTGANGLHVVDTTDPANPVQLAYRNVSQLSNLTLRAGVTIGNLLVLSTSFFPTFNGKVLLLDISDPANPTQIAAPFDVRIGYQGFVYGSSFFGAQDGALESYNFANPANIVKTTHNADAGTTLDRPEYGFGKDGFAFIGHYPGATKWDLSQSPAPMVSNIAIQNPANDDYAFITPLGNMIAITSDHGTAKKLSIGVHDTARDSLPPAANFVLPANGAVNMNRKSRVGVCFTDFIEASSLNTGTLIVRSAATQQVVPGSYSHMMGIVNFAPDGLLAADTTYEVVLAAGGVRDWAGNAVAAEQVISTFSTGSTISYYRMSVAADSPRVVGQTANFTASNIGVATLNLEHAWDFGDGTPLTAFSPALTASHTYQSAGNFTVSLHTRVVGQTEVTFSTAVQVVHLPIPAVGPSRSSTIIHDAATARVWNVNADNGTVTAIQAVSPHAKVLETPVGSHPATLASGPGGTIWVTIKKDSAISIVNSATGALTATVNLPAGSSPHGIVMLPDLTKAYITLEGRGEVVEMDTASRLVTRTVSTGPQPRNLAYDPSRQHLLVTRFVSPDDAGKITRVDTITFTVAGTISLVPSMDADSSTNGRGLPNYLGALAISPDLSQAVVPSKKDNIFRGMKRDGLPLTFEHSVRSIAMTINLQTGAENLARRVDLDNNDIATAAVYSPLGNRLFVTTLGSKEIWVFDAYGGSSTFAFESGGSAPDGITISPDGSRLFVHNFMERSVSVFNAGIICASVCGTAPAVADVSTVAVESLSPAVLLGKRLFHDSYDTRLAQDGYMSCASCHFEGGNDGRVWDFTHAGEGLRNTIDLNGRGAGHGPLHWTANFDEVHDFEGQIRSFSAGTGLLTDPQFAATSHPLGAPKAGISPELDALAAYVASLTTAGVSPHRNPDGSLTTDAIAGREIFLTASCTNCHSGTSFTDSATLARHNVGTLTSDSGQRLGAVLDGLDTPTLRGLWKSAPYLHDGSAPTLMDVLTTRNPTGQHANLTAYSPAQLGQLVAYLNQIDDYESAPAEIGIPQITALDPPDESLGKPLDTDLTVTFDRFVKAGTGLMTLMNLTAGSQSTIHITDASQVSIIGPTLTIQPTANLLPGNRYAILIAGTAITDLLGNPFPGILQPTQWNFRTTGGDNIPPLLLTSLPAPGSAGQPLRPTLSITFDNNVLVGGGFITIQSAHDNAVVKAIDVTSSAVTINGPLVTVQLTDDLAIGTTHFVTISPGAFTSVPGVPYGGLSGASAWSFTTAGPAIVYEDTFDNDGLATNAGVGGGLVQRTISTTTFGDNGNLVDTAGGNNSNRGVVSSINSFILTNGFTLEVRMTGGTAAIAQSFGLSKSQFSADTNAECWMREQSWAGEGANGRYGIGVQTGNSNPGGEPTPRGLKFNNGAKNTTAITNLSTTTANLLPAGTNTFVITVTPDDQFSYTYNGGTPVTGEIVAGAASFDLSQPLFFNLYSQSDVSISYVKITRLAPASPPSAYDSWATTYAPADLSDPDDDHDRDGMNNQEEFAFGLNPTLGSSVNPIAQQLADGVFKYTRTKDSGLTYKVYYSTTLSGWTMDEFASQIPAPAVAGVETVTVTLASAAPANGRLFVRVEATPAPTP